MALASAVVVGLLAIDFHGIYLGIAGWALLLAAVCVAFWLGTLFPRHCVVAGGEIVVHHDHVLIPRAFSGPADDVPFDELELEVTLQPSTQTIVIDGRPQQVAFSTPARVTIGRRDKPRVLHPSVFAQPTHALRLADDVRRLRAGLALADHDDPDLGAMLADVQHVLAAMYQPAAPPAAEDEYDARLEEELRALDAPKKPGQE
ncbi:MAG: hypothetical protein ABI175_20400 [Polyangiales bacterium]